MASKNHGRRSANARVKTPLTELTEALSANYGVMGRRAAVVAAAGGLFVAGTLPNAAAGEATADTASGEVKAPEFVAQPQTVVPTAAEDAPAVTGGLHIDNVTAAKAPEAEALAQRTATNSRGSSAQSSDSTQGGEESAAADSVQLPDGDKAQQVIAVAEQYVGTPYRSGGSSPSGFDCSGFTSFVFSQVGKSLPRTSGGQRNAGTVVSASEARPGDLVWHPGHVGIYAGNGMMYDGGSSRSGTSYRSHSWMGNVTYIRVF